MHAFAVFWRGLVMGLAEVVPGVSGGTVALITGIYERLIGAIASFGPQSLRMLHRPVQFYNAHDLAFLLPLAAGMGVGILAFASVMQFLIAQYAPLVWAFFAGIILATAIRIGLRVTGAVRYVLIPIGVIAGLALGAVPLQQADPSNAAFFFAGALAICAWILPAVSGSYMLLVVGLYPAVMGAISTLAFDVLLVFAAGCALGLAAFVRVLRFLLARYYDALMSFLVGFMLGSVVNLWPWQATTAGSRLSGLMSPDGYASVIGPPYVAFTVLALITGFVLLWLFDRRQTARK